MKNRVWIILAFVIGWAFGLSFSLTVRPAPDECLNCQTLLALCDRWRLVPTATPHNCPALPPPCPTVLYKPLPNVTYTLSTLGLADYELSLVDTKLENYITSAEGEYDWTLVGILALHRSAHNYLQEASDDVVGWFNLGELTCPE